MVSMQAPARMRMETIALTPAGRAGLELELQRLREEHLPAMTWRLAEAWEDSAARDDDASRLELQEEQQRLERRARELERLLAMAGEVMPPADGVAALGSRVVIDDDGERDAFHLVDPCEANPTEGRISIVCPVGRALLGQAVGAEVVVRLPAGERHLRLVSLA